MYRVSILSKESTRRLSWPDNLLHGLYNCSELVQKPENKTKIIFHIDGKLNLADLLTKHHELTVDSVTMHSVWQTGLPWMHLDVESMPLLVYEQLTVDKISEAEVMAECYEKVLTGEFSQFPEDQALLVYDLLELDDSNKVEVMVECQGPNFEASHHITESVNKSNSSSILGSARVQINLLVDPVLHG